MIIIILYSSYNQLIDIKEIYLHGQLTLYFKNRNYYVIDCYYNFYIKIN
jgi:hypothetical protein